MLTSTKGLLGQRFKLTSLTSVTSSKLPVNLDPFVMEELK